MSGDKGFPCSKKRKNQGLTEDTADSKKYFPEKDVDLRFKKTG